MKQKIKTTLILPIIPGLICLLLGLYVLSFRSEKAKNLHAKIYAKFPKFKK